MVCKVRSRAVPHLKRTPISTHTFVLYGILGGASSFTDNICVTFTNGTSWEGSCLVWEPNMGVGISSLANTTFANSGSLQNANGATTVFAPVLGGSPVVFQLVKTGAQLQGFYCPDGQNVTANCFLLFTDTTPFLTPNAVAVIAGARGGARASTIYLESYQ